MTLDTSCQAETHGICQTDSAQSSMLAAERMHEQVRLLRLAGVAPDSAPTSPPFSVFTTMLQRHNGPGEIDGL